MQDSDNTSQPDKATNKPKKNNFIQVEEHLNSVFDFRYNTVLNIYQFKNKSDSEFVDLDADKIYAYLCRQNYDISTQKLKAMFKSDLIKEYNPFKEYFEKLPVHDGVDHIKNLCGYIKSTDNERFEVQLRKHLVRCVKQVYVNDYFNKHCFVIMSRNTETNRAQSLGKTTLINWFVPKSLSGRYSTTDFNPSFNDVCNRNLCECFIINIDELANLNKSDIDATKRYLSQSFTRMRLPYDRNFSELKRNASFFGTTNKEEFLNDPSGSVRWISFELTEINFMYKQDISIDKVWSQAYQLFRDGFSCELTSEEINQNEKSNTQFKEQTIEMELIEKHFIPDPHEDEFYTSNQIYALLAELEPPQLLKRVTPQTIGKALSYLNYSRKSKRTDGKSNPVYGYFIRERSGFRNPPKSYFTN